MNDFLSLLPTHKCELTLTHNTHTSSYQTVAEWEVDYQQHFGHLVQWVSEEQRAKAIATNEVWSIQWYPETPIGSYTLYACDLDVLLKAACE